MINYKLNGLVVILHILMAIGGILCLINNKFQTWADGPVL